jgi:demethylmenaquinone methyltransferase/2-methoxy-6-polyprenyl-1,4-benzoquinol methylase
MAFLFQRVVDAAFAVLFVGRRRAAYEPLLDILDPSPGERVLDAGSGGGWLGRRLATRVGPDGSVVGIDPSASAIAYANEKAGPTEEYIQGSITEIPLPAESVDRVITSLVIHHVDPAEQPMAFSEMARTLRPGGTLLVVELQRPSSTWSRVAFGWQGCVRASLPDADLRSLADSAGLVDIETGRHWRWLRWMRATRPAT